MNRFELLAMLLIMLLALGGGWLLGARFGMPGYIIGFVAGAFLLPIGIWVLLKILPRRRN